MSNRVGDSQQPSIPEPAQLGIEHVWLAGAVVALTTAVVALVVEDQTSVVVFRGAYSVLAGLFVCGCVGWKVAHAERRMRREYNQDRRALAAQLARMSANQAAVLSALESLRSQVAAQRWANVPGQRTPNRWPRQVAMAVGGDTPADAEAATQDRIRAAREAGVEEGFDIGLEVKLADLGVPVLRRRERRRLTGDS